MKKLKFTEVRFGSQHDTGDGFSYTDVEISFGQDDESADPGGFLKGQVPSYLADRLKAFLLTGEDAIEKSFDALSGTATMRREAEAIGLNANALFLLAKAKGL